MSKNNTNPYIDNNHLEFLIVEYRNSKKEKKKYELILSDLKESMIYNKEKEEIYKIIYSKYIKVSEHIKEIYNLLAVEFSTLAEHIIKFKHYDSVEYDDAMQEFVMICFDKMDRFDPNFVGKTGQKSKAFSFLTTCVLNSYRQLCRYTNNYNELKKRYSNILRADEKNARFKGKKYYCSYTRGESNSKEI